GPQKGLGGGIFNTGTLSLYNTTVSANTASGTNASGGGLHNSSGTLTLVNSAVAGNASESGTAPDCAGALTSSGYTLIGTLTDCTYTPGPGDLTGVSAGIMRWGDVLQLTTGSQGIDAGDPAGCRDQAGGLLAVDAYGTTRPLDGDGNGTARCDIGASEYDPAHPLQLMFLPCLTRACPPSYWDDFGNPASGWYTGDSPETLYAYAGGEYQLLVRRADYFAAARAPGLQVSDFIATLDVRSVSQTDASYGLIFGLAADWSSFYLFEIDATGWFGLWRYNSNQTWTRLAGGTSAAIQTGSASNRLKVARNGAAIQALVNNQLVASVSDSTLTGLRRLAVSVFTYNQPDADIRFDNLLVYPVSCGLGNILAQPSAEAGPASWSGPTDR
ncbi:MAG: hypothetical protein JNK29_16280, partial [Anaerolineales bacterium]|nr:hypothetical protein [Anaerolineales bacterium]